MQFEQMALSSFNNFSKENVAAGISRLSHKTGAVNIWRCEHNLLILRSAYEILAITSGKKGSTRLEIVLIDLIEFEVWRANQGRSEKFFSRREGMDFREEAVLLQ